MRCQERINLSDDTSKDSKVCQCELPDGHSGSHEIHMTVQWDKEQESCFHRQELPPEKNGEE